MKNNDIESKINNIADSKKDNIKMGINDTLYLCVENISRKIGVAVDILNDKLEELSKNYSKVLYMQFLINRKGFDKVAYSNSNDLEKVSNILYDDNVRMFLDTCLSYKEYEKIYKLLYPKNYKLYLKEMNVDIKDNKHTSVESFCSLMQVLCKSKKSLIKLNDLIEKYDNVPKVHKFKKIKTIMNDDNIEEKLVEEPYRKYMASLNIYLSKNKTLINQIKLIISLYNDLSSVDINDDYNKFKLLYDEIYRLIKKTALNDDIFEEIKLEARKMMKEYEEKNFNSKNNSNTKTKDELIKYGNRSDRKSEYEKKKLKGEIKELKKNLSSNDKLWEEILVDELTSLDKNMKNDFVVNYMSYLPSNKDNDLKKIALVTMKELEYKDFDKDIINALKKVL